MPKAIDTRTPRGTHVDHILCQIGYGKVATSNGTARIAGDSINSRPVKRAILLFCAALWLLNFTFPVSKLALSPSS